MHTWDPERYLAFADERGRPFLDLLARVGPTAPRRVADLGCGPGNLTAVLKERWPGAEVLGLDSSPEMVAAAVPRPGLSFQVADLRDWAAPEGGVDVLVSNATLQWVPDHLALLPRLLGEVAPGGWFAFQVPANFAEPSHTLCHALADEPAYAGWAAGVAQPSSHDPRTYLDALAQEGVVVDAWETTYLHVLAGPDPVFAWVSGTGARPTLQAMPPEVRPGFEAELKRRLRAAYPERHGRVVMPFRRVFVVAHRAGGGS